MGLCTGITFFFCPEPVAFRRVYGTWDLLVYHVTIAAPYPGGIDPRLAVYARSWDGHYTTTRRDRLVYGYYQSHVGNLRSSRYWNRSCSVWWKRFRVSKACNRDALRLGEAWQAITSSSGTMPVSGPRVASYTSQDHWGSATMWKHESGSSFSQLGLEPTTQVWQLSYSSS